MRKHEKTIYLRQAEHAGKKYTVRVLMTDRQLEWLIRKAFLLRDKRKRVPCHGGLTVEFEKKP